MLEYDRAFACEPLIHTSKVAVVTADTLRQLSIPLHVSGDEREKSKKPTKSSPT